MKECIVLLILAVYPRLLAQEGNAEKIAAFIQSPPPIREMVVECLQYDNLNATTKTKWVTLSWQTNAYIFRTSTERTEVFDTFDTNRDERVTIRAGEVFSSVSTDKVLGVHIRQVRGLSRPGERDLVTGSILSHQLEVGQVLSAGVPVPMATVVFVKGTFRHHKPDIPATVSGEMQFDGNNVVKGFNVTNEIHQTENRRGKVVLLPVHFTYGGGDQPSWFPHQMWRDAVFESRTLPICRFKVHCLKLGEVPQTEFYPERFLPGPVAGGIVTSNGLSFVTFKGVTKPAADPQNPWARGVTASIRGQRALYAILAVLFGLGTLALGIAGRRKREGQ